VHYTVGQRRGLGVAAGRPLYVVDVDAARNRVTVGREGDLLSSEAVVREVNWVSCAPPAGPLEVEAKIRYRARPAPARLVAGSGGVARLYFRDPQRAISPGQSAVFYRGDVLLGGGVLTRPF
jgi:tRNA-specific 2-thiouridylase